MRIPWCSPSRVEAAQVGVSRLARQRLGKSSGRHQQLVEEHAPPRTLQDRAGVLLGCRAPTAGQLRGYRGGAIEKRGHQAILISGRLVTALIAAWVRFPTPSFPKRPLQYTLTVASVTPRARAISLFACPLTRKARVSRSRGEREADISVSPRWQPRYPSCAAQQLPRRDRLARQARGVFPAPRRQTCA